MERLGKLQDWTRQSLQKSLSNDWIHESSSHKFPLRQFYVQLEWKKKLRKAMVAEKVDITSIHEVIKQIKPVTHVPEEKSHQTEDASSVLIEGKNVKLD